MTHENLQKILSKYNLEIKEIFPFQKGYRNKSFPILLTNGEMVNLILYKNEPHIYERIKRTNFVSNFYSNLGFNTRKSIEVNGKDILKIKLGKNIRYISLYNYLEGETIPWEAYTKEHIKLLGEMMGKIHGEGRRLQATGYSFNSVISEMDDQVSGMKRYFENVDVINALIEKLGISVNRKVFFYFEKLVDKLKDIEETQILHMDFVRSNVLFSVISINQELKTKNLFITGILDFEKCSIGPTIIDIARTLAFLIVDCKKKDELKVRKYFLYSGYQKRGNGKIKNIKLLNPLLDFFWFYDFYKFLKHNPYESLNENHHFLRTVGSLRKSSIL